MPQRLTLLSGEQATEASSFPLSGGIGETNRIPYTELGAHITTQLEAPRKARRLEHHKDESINQLQYLGSQEPLGTNSPSKWRGK
jgi:hypothetical protein